MITDKGGIDRRIRRTKRNLQSAFILLLNEKDYYRITVTDIVTQADYNRATFYRHYQDKESLVQDLINIILEDLIKSFRYPYKNKKWLSVDSLSSSNVIIFYHILDNVNFYRLWKDSEGIPGFQTQFINTLIQLHKNDISNYANPDMDMDDELFITYRAYGVWGLIINWIKSDFQIPVEDMTDQLIKILNYHPSSRYKLNHF
ncbi:TetR/AcrR family transcriptional regulator [Oceanobacillus timonensis]|uniref:TetR/AcrR family transcriptional regulator n=1 Tax=Oceanobacillus timonensis TaxID=1926285 RepID=UPI0009BB3D9F|nr:TetR/AcrR family transcriptional regulator [Oceanobacillus timonensis]